MKSAILAVMLFIFQVSNIYSETYTVNGVVKDGSTGEPLAFANIVILETSHGTAADQHGKFTLNFNKGNYKLRCSYVGYKTVISPISINSDIQITITMNSIDMLLQNVTVYATRQGEIEQKEVSALSLQSEKLGEVTSLIPDVLRSVQMLPGVAVNNEFSSKFNVRGGSPDENLVLINGTQVYEPYHVKEAPNASIGIFNTDMIRKMDLITGGFSARYGDRVSSVVNIEYREGDRNNFKGQASLSMTDLTGLAEGPLGKNGSFIIGIRQSYFQFVLNMLNVEESIHPSFYDVQGVLAYNLAANHKLTFKFIHAGDNFYSDPEQNLHGPYKNYINYNGTIGWLTRNWNDSASSRAKYYSTMLALQSTNIISSNALLKSEISFYDQKENEHAGKINYYRDNFNADNNNSFYQNINYDLYNNDLNIRTLEINSSYDLQLNSLYWLKTGLSYQRIFYNNNYINATTISEITDRINYPDTTYNFRYDNQSDNNIDSINTQSYKAAGYIENIFQLGDKIILNIGGRFDYFDLNKDLTWSPRINFSYNITPSLILRGAWGHYYQSPVYQQIAYSTASDTNTQSERAIHYILGLEYNIISDPEEHKFLKLKIEGYHKTYDNLISSTVSSSGYIYYSRKNDAVGRTSGIDLYFMYSAGIFSGWISYSLLKAEQKILDDPYGYFPRNTDQRHTIAVYADIDLGKNWKLGSRFVYGSGFAYTPSTAAFNYSSGIWEWKTGDPNSAHFPSYKRADIRLSKNFELFNFVSSAFLDISNLFNFKNIQAYQYTFSSNGQPVIKEVKLWPVLPTFGIAVKF
jgi:outer membrane receptor protein involved in Fe transport